MVFTGLGLYILGYFLYTRTHTHAHAHTHAHIPHPHTHTNTTNIHTPYTPVHTHSQTHRHTCTHTHTHTVHIFRRQKGMIHLRVLFWLANLLLLRMTLTVAQSCNPQSQNCQLCATQSCSGFRVESKYHIDLYTSQTSSPVIYPLKLPLS